MTFHMIYDVSHIYQLTTVIVFFRVQLYFMSEHSHGPSMNCVNNLLAMHLILLWESIAITQWHDDIGCGVYQQQLGYNT